MNSKAHLAISLIKSAIRVIGCCLTICKGSLVILAGSFLLAECLGVLEELADKR